MPYIINIRRNQGNILTELNVFTAIVAEADLDNVAGLLIDNCFVRRPKPWLNRTTKL